MVLGTMGMRESFVCRMCEACFVRGGQVFKTIQARTRRAGADVFSSFPLRNLHATSVILIDLKFDPTRVGTHPVREQFTPLAVRRLTFDTLLREMRVGPPDRHRLLSQMTQEGLNEHHGLKTMPADFTRCGAFIRVFPTKVPGVSEGVDTTFVPITIQQTHSSRTKGPRPWKFDKPWAEHLLERLKGKPMTGGEIISMEDQVRGTTH